MPLCCTAGSCDSKELNALQSTPSGSALPTD
jgi:hypothetical protein